MTLPKFSTFFNEGVNVLLQQRLLEVWSNKELRKGLSIVCKKLIETLAIA